MQYTVVHSKDPYLLARLATNLQMEGYDDEELYFNDSWHPFNGRNMWLRVHCDDDSLFFMNHEGCISGDRHELTSLNYIKVLTQILEP